MSTSANPIPDDQLAEVKRLHAAATKGKLRAVGYRLSHEANREIGQTVFHLDEIGQIGTGPYQAIPFARREDAEWHAALHNASGPILARLEAAERERDRWKIAYAEEFSGQTRQAADAQQRREGAAEAWDIVAERSKLVGDAAGETYATEAAKRLRDGQ